MNHLNKLKKFKQKLQLSVKTMFLLIAFFAGLSGAFAQLSVTVTNPTNATPNLSASYSSLASAITALNATTTFSGPVTFTCSGSSETAPSGGFSISYTATTTATNKVVINGSNTTVYAAAMPTSGTQNDAIFKIIGSDYLTIQNFVMNENPSNNIDAALASQRMTEFGVALFAATATNGAQNNTIQNNTINLSSSFGGSPVYYRNAIGIFSTTASAATAPASGRPSTSTAGANSNNKIYGNTITGVATGIYFIAPAQTTSTLETGNDIGGTSGATGNTITYGFGNINMAGINVNNVASDLTWTSFSGAALAGIYFRNVVGNSARFNTITNWPSITLSNGAIFSAVGSAPTGITYTSNFSNNTINLYTLLPCTAITGIDFGSGITTGTITSNNNNVTILSTSIDLANATTVIGIKAAYPAATSTVNSNTVLLNPVITNSALVSIGNTGAQTCLSVPSGIGSTISVMSNNLKIVRTGSLNATFGGAETGILATAAATNMNIGASGTGNTIAMYDTIQGVSSFNTPTYISAGAAHVNLNISYNTLGSGIGIFNSTGTVTGILHTSAAVVTSININNNTFTLDRTTSNGGTFTAINGGGSALATMASFSISNNTVNYTGPVTAAGGFNGIVNTDLIAITFAKNFSNNSFTATGNFSTVTGLNVYGGKNEITGNTFDLTSNNNATTITMYGITGSLGNANNKYNVYSNTFTNIRSIGTSTVSPTIYGIFLTGGVNNNIYNNNITNLSATGLGVAIVAGIALQSSTVADTTNIFKNNINNLVNNATGFASSISGIRIIGSSGSALAITNIYNNLISQTNSLSNISNSGASIYGIYLNTTSALTTHNIYYNTIYLSSTSTGANFGANGIYHTANSSATVSSLNLRNNIIVNLVTPTGTGTSYAYQRSSNIMTNYASASNNNMFYCTSGIFNNFAYTDMTMSDFISRVGPRELNSVSESLTFLNTSTPTNSQYLKLDAAYATQTESGGAAITGFTDDYLTSAIRTGYPKSGQTNGGGTAPDMGAYEMDLIPQDLTGPSILYTPIASTTNTSAVTITASIADKSGVPTSGAGLPVLYWKSGLNSYAPATGTYVSGSNYSFTFGGGSVNDIISYYFVAQDNNGYVSISPSAGASGTTNNPPFVSTPPSSPSSYNILSPWSGTYVIGSNGSGNIASGADYISLSDAFADVTPGQVRSVYVTAGGTGFLVAPTVTITGGGGVGATATATIDGTGAIVSINVTNYGSGYSYAPSILLTNNTGSGASFTANISSGKAMAGATTLSLSSNYNSVNENSFPITIPEIIGTSATNTVIIKPASGVTTSISGSSTTSIINFNGADYVTIDGSNNGSTSRDLAVTNTNSTSVNAVIQVTSLGTAAGATFNTIKNLNISNGSADQSNYAIHIGSATLGTGGADNDNLTIQNNNITSANYGIYANGTAAVTAGANDNLLVTGNTITINSNFVPAGIRVGNSLTSTVSLNTIDIINRDNTLSQNFQNNTPTGISLEAGFLSSTVTRNKIVRVKSLILSGSGARGITIGTGSTSSNLIVSNNVIYGVEGVNSQSFYNGSFLYSSSIGLTVGGGIGGDVSTAAVGVKLYYNSVSMTGSYSNNLSTNPITTAAVYIGAAVTTLDMRNNIFSNSQTNTSLGALAKSYAIYSGAASTAYTTNDYNDYYVSGVHGVLGYLTSDRTNLAGIQTGFTQNTHSLVADPTFNGVNNLKPSLGASILTAGVVLSGQTVDFLGNTRSGSTPAMGAYESGADESAPTITYTTLPNTQSTGNQTISATIADVGSVNSGVNTTTASPIIYFKKSTDANVFGVTNDNTGNGWKYVQTSSTTSPFTMSIDMSLLQTSPVLGDVIQYFVVAQDNNGYLSANPSIGFVGTNVTTITSAPTTPNYYTIVGPPLNAGTYIVGTSATHDYTTITAAMTDVNLRGIAGPIVLELIDANYSSSETFPITFGAVVGASATNTITLRPSLTSSAVSVGSSNTTGIFNFDNGSYYTLDGRAGGVGSTNIMNIYNNSITTGYTLNYINDAMYNNVKYTNVQGSAQAFSTATFTYTAGTIQIGTTNQTYGNDTNSFTYCNIYDGAATPQVAVYALGTTGKSNDYNIFRNNNIYNFNGTFNSNGNLYQSSFGLYIDGNNNSYAVDNNNFYQTSARQQTSGGSTNIISAVYITAASGTTKGVDYSITGNYIGGSAAQCAGSPMTYNATTLAIANSQLIYADCGTSRASNIQGNTINNILVNTNASSNHYLINIFGGRVNVGTVTPNYIGSQTSTGAIILSSGATTSLFVAIGTGSTTAAAYDTVRIQNNVIGGLEANINRNSPFATGSPLTATSLRGIDITTNASGIYYINNNTIGGTVANSMKQSCSNNVAGAVGIFCRTTSALPIHQINNNIVRNLTTTHYLANIIGIGASGAHTCQFKNNSVTYLTTASTATTTGTTASLIGMSIANTGTLGTTVDNNLIHTLVSNADVAVTLTGLMVSGASTGTNTVTKNTIHSIKIARNGSTINGIDVVTGAFTYANNMLRLGVDQTGANMAISLLLRGINETAGTNNYYFNTVYVGGGTSVAAGADYSYGFISNVASGTRSIKNNIFSNKRQSVSGSIAKHYAISIANTTGLTSNYNNYYTNAAPIGVYNTIDAAAISDWKVATVQDANTITENPIFVSANGSNTSVDLHITPGSISLMESGGTNISGYATDIDGDVRPGPVGSTNGGGTASDIGADEFDGSLFQLNVGALSLASPSGSCASSGKTVSIRIKNYACSQAIDFSQNPVVVTASVSGTNPTTFNPVTLTSGTLAPGATMDIDFTSAYDMTALGTYTFNASTSLFGDANASNDAMVPSAITITSLSVGNNTSSISQICGSSGTPTLTTTATGGNIQWRQSSVSANGPWTNVGTNSTTYTPSSPISTTTYYSALLTCNSTSMSAGDTVTVQVPEILSYSGSTSCANSPASLSATANTTQVINWYTSAVATVPVYTGTTYTPTVSSTTTYYASAATTQNVLTSTTGANTWNQNTTLGLSDRNTSNQCGVFDASKDIHIASLDIYPFDPAGTSFTIQVRQSSASTGALIATYSGVTSVQNTGTPSVAQTVPVDFNIPAGTNYVIFFTTNPNCWRGGSFAFPYPFTSNGFSYRAAGFGSALSGTTSNLLYYFYNFIISSACESARQPVVANVNPQPNAPSAPSTVSKTASSIDVSWNAVSGATSYSLDVATDAGFNSLVSGYSNLSVAGTSQSITGLSSLTTYYVRVRTENGTCSSQNSSSLTEITNANTVSVHVTAFLQGLNLGGGLMSAAPFNADGISPNTLADTITVELHDVNTLATTYSSRATLSTSGIANVSFPGAAVGGSYYIAIIHRNSIATWSAASISIASSGTTYNFSTAATQAAGSNLVNDGSGVYMIYTGDINQDGAVDFSDYPSLDIASSNGVLGYDTNDLNGDGSVDFSDYPMIDINSSNGVLSTTP